ncbi:MAG: glycosyltransferase [Actinobacteria bacterium]|nr:glycosyltransferase [Actinomycetota bacterium]
MPLRNEARFVREAVQSVLDQDLPGLEIEVLAVDGLSTDGSREILNELAARGGRLRIIDNPYRLTPHALNLGLRAAAGEHVGIFGSHAAYDRDYVATCLDELRRHGAVGCSGRIVATPADESLSARLVTWTLGSSFASSGRSFRTAPEGYADTIAYPIFRKDALLELGGYNERLVRNQDNDMNERLRAAGHRLYLTWKTTARYRTQPGLRPLMRYAYRAGYWNFVTLRENIRAMRGRHFAPLVFVNGLAAAAVAAGASAAAGDKRLAAGFGLAAAAALALHLAAGLATSLRIALRERSAAALLVAPFILAFHLSYGAGTSAALLRRARPPSVQALREPAGEATR